MRDLSDPARLIPHLQTKVQSFSRDKRKALMVSYIDARDAAQILDDVLGPEKWSTRVTQPPVKVDGGWTAVVSLSVDGVSREDFGTGEGGLDNGAKGAVSDAIKRAAVQFGVGRALYSLSPQWAQTHEWAQGKFDVRDPEKQAVVAKWRKELEALAKAWKKGQPLPPAPAGDEPSEPAAPPAQAPQPASDDEPRTITEGQRRRMFAIANEHGVSTDDLKDIVRGVAGVESSKQIPLDKYDAVISALEGNALFGPDRREDVG